MTDKEKQILEIKDAIDSVYCGDCAYYGVDGFAIAEELYSRGYRKQTEGEWEERIFIIFDTEKVGYHCPKCSTTWDVKTNYCPNCGAKMKGGAE